MDRKNNLVPSVKVETMLQSVSPKTHTFQEHHGHGKGEDQGCDPVEDDGELEKVTNVLHIRLLVIVAEVIEKIYFLLGHVICWGHWKDRVVLQE